MAINQPIPQKPIRIEIMCDGFAIAVGDEFRYWFDQEDADVGERLVELFQRLGYNNVSTQECY